MNTSKPKKRAFHTQTPNDLMAQSHDDSGTKIFFSSNTSNGSALTEESDGNGAFVARVTAVDRDQYIIRNADGELPAELTGKFAYLRNSHTELPCVGDWVHVQYYDSASRASIHEVLPRKTFLRRKRPGKNIEFQMIAANIDTAFIVQSCHLDFNVRRLERYLVMVNEGQIEPVIVLTKTDLVSSEELEQKIEQIRRTGIVAQTHCAEQCYRDRH